MAELDCNNIGFKNVDGKLVCAGRLFQEKERKELCQMQLSDAKKYVFELSKRYPEVKGKNALDLVKKWSDKDLFVYCAVATAEYRGSWEAGKSNCFCHLDNNESKQNYIKLITTLDKEAY